MSDAGRPEFSELERAECLAMLAAHRFGRVAFSFHDRVDIQPISYRFDHDWLFGRTAAGTKLLTLHHHPWVALEVDEVRGPFDWRSVVVHGTFHHLEGDGSPRDSARWTRALTVLREEWPDTLTANDPTPDRTVLFGISVQEITGRSAKPTR